MQVFLSYSTSDEVILQKLADALGKRGIDVYVADREPQFGISLSFKIRRAIAQSDAVVAILTKEGTDSPSVNQEVGYALASGIPIVPVVEEGARLGVLLQGVEQLRFIPKEADEIISRVLQYVEMIHLRERARPQIPFEDGLNRALSERGLNRTLDLKILNLDDQVMRTIVTVEEIARAIRALSGEEKEGWVSVSRLLRWIDRGLPLPMQSRLEIAQELLEKCATLGAIVYDDATKKTKYCVTALGHKTLTSEIQAVHRMRLGP